MHGVTITELIEKMKLRNTTPDIDTDKIVLTHPDVNGFRSLDMWRKHILILWTGSRSAGCMIS